jgi:hypothetical protein
VSDLIKRLRENYAYSLSITSSPYRHVVSRLPVEAADALEAANSRIAELEQELRHIANADTVEWDDPTQFEAWAKSRARYTLGKGR